MRAIDRERERKCRDLLLHGKSEHVFFGQYGRVKNFFVTLTSAPSSDRHPNCGDAFGGRRGEGATAVQS